MSDRTDAEILAQSDARMRCDMDPETERLRMLQQAREEIRKACHILADPYDQLALGKWAEQGMSLGALAENVVSELLAARAQIERLKALLESERVCAQQRSEEAERNLKRATFAERQLEACEALKGGDR